MKIVLWFAMTILISNSLWGDVHASEKLAIKRLIESLQSESLPSRIDKISAFFLKEPYAGGALGEGDVGIYDKDPLYRFDRFDCTTYVETVLALAKAQSFKEFEFLMDQIRYKDGVVTFVTRNHFPSLDWIPNNQWLLEDITMKVSADFQIANALIDKKNWFGKLTIDAIQGINASEEEKLRLLKDLKQEGVTILPEPANIAFVALENVFQDGKVNQDILENIPSGVVINIVRPNWNLQRIIGTNMNVSHQGILIRLGNRLLFRHASGTNKEVVEVDFIDYLRPYLNSETVKGFNVQQVMP